MSFLKNRSRGVILRALAALCLLPALICACAAGAPEKSGAREDGARANGEKEYGVFLGYEGALSALEDCRAVVIDAQYYEKEEIAEFRQKGHTVYSYLNIGSLEDFRPYYERFKRLALGRYEHWAEEVWIDPSDGEW